MKKSRNFNGKFDDIMFKNNDFNWDDLPLDLEESTRKRLLVSQKMPAQSVLVHLRIVDTLLNHLMKCPDSKDSRVSRTYFDRTKSILGKVGGFIGVTESQSDSRLHLHLLSYPSTMIPNLLTQIMPSEVLRRKAKYWINRTSTTYLSKETNCTMRKCLGNFY